MGDSRRRRKMEESFGRLLVSPQPLWRMLLWPPAECCGLLRLHKQKNKNRRRFIIFLAKPTNCDNASQWAIISPKPQREHNLNTWCFPLFPSLPPSLCLSIFFGSRLAAVPLKKFILLMLSHCKTSSRVEKLWRAPPPPSDARETEVLLLKWQPQHRWAHGPKMRPCKYSCRLWSD